MWTGAVLQSGKDQAPFFATGISNMKNAHFALKKFSKKTVKNIKDVILSYL